MLVVYAYADRGRQHQLSARHSRASCGVMPHASCLMRKLPGSRAGGAQSVQCDPVVMHAAHEPAAARRRPLLWQLPQGRHRGAVAGRLAAAGAAGRGARADHHAGPASGRGARRVRGAHQRRPPHLAALQCAPAGPDPPGVRLGASAAPCFSMRRPALGSTCTAGLRSTGQAAASACGRTSATADWHHPCVSLA